MTKFESLFKQYKEALERFTEILNEEKTSIVRDVALKRFEFTFDLAWKVIQVFLKEDAHQQRIFQEIVGR